MNHDKLKSKILIVDDEEAIAELLEKVLKKEGFENIYLAFSAKEALKHFEKEEPDLVLLDIMLPDGNGYDLFKSFELIKKVPVLFISAKNEEVDRLLGFALGAEDYISKPFSPKEVAYRVKARLKYLQKSPEKTKTSKNEIISFGDISIDLEGSQVKKGNELLDFTAKEYKLLLFLVENPNKILSKERICQVIWGQEFIGLDNTISVHIRKIRLKIEADPSKPQWIKTVIGLGYKFVLPRRDHES